MRPFKGIFCANISEFESYSQASWVSVACGLGYVGRAGHRGAAIASDGPGAARRVLEYTRHLNKLRTEKNASLRGAWDELARLTGHDIVSDFLPGCRRANRAKGLSLLVGGEQRQALSITENRSSVLRNHRDR
jgi:hypothetical protein